MLFITAYCEVEKLLARADKYGDIKGEVGRCFLDAHTYNGGEVDIIFIYYRGEEFYAHSVEDAADIIANAEAHFAEARAWRKDAVKMLREMEAATVAHYRATGEWVFEENYSDLFKDVYGFRPRYRNEDLLEIY